MNRFRDHTMRQQYESAVKAYRVKHRDLFINGARRKPGGYGSSFAMFFWHGFDGETTGTCNFSDNASRSMIGYAYYRAGQDMSKSHIS